MPCKDTTAVVTVKLDASECLEDFDFSKLTCSKAIGSGSDFKSLCRGKPVEELLALEFAEVLRTLDLQSSEDQFLLYLEWDALHSTLCQYLGKTEGLDSERYRIESIVHEEDHVEIRQVIRPPSEMPRITSCLQRQRAEER